MVPRNIILLTGVKPGFPGIWVLLFTSYEVELYVPYRSTGKRQETKQKMNTRTT